MAATERGLVVIEVVCHFDHQVIRRLPFSSEEEAQAHIDSIPTDPDFFFQFRIE